MDETAGDPDLDAVVEERTEAVAEMTERQRRFPHPGHEIESVIRYGFGADAEVEITWRDARQGEPGVLRTQRFALVTDDWAGISAPQVAAEVWLEIFET